MAQRKRKVLRLGIYLVLFVSIYPAFVLGITWSYVLKSDLDGGRHGPLDAYRHALASAIVSYTIGDSAVEAVTHIFESSGRESNGMDQHNNSVGAKIGMQAKAFSELEPAVNKAVRAGQSGSAEVDQITWLAKDKWREAKLW